MLICVEKNAEPESLEDIRQPRESYFLAIEVGFCPLSDPPKF